MSTHALMLVAAATYCCAAVDVHAQEAAGVEVADYWCVPEGREPPAGYFPLPAQVDQASSPEPICECPSAKPYALPIANIVTVAGTWKIVKITHDLQLEDVAKNLTYVGLPPSTIKKTAPTVHDAMTGKLARKGGLFGLGFAAGLLAWKTYETYTGPEEPIDADMKAFLVKKATLRAYDESETAGLKTAEPKSCTPPTRKQLHLLRDSSVR